MCISFISFWVFFLCFFSLGKEAVESWYSEIKDYDWSSPGFNGKTGKTQMERNVWNVSMSYKDHFCTYLHASCNWVMQKKKKKMIAIASCSCCFEIIDKAFCFKLKQKVVFFLFFLHHVFCKLNSQHPALTVLHCCVPPAGHFTQVVWKASTKLGVGMATDGKRAFVVGQYRPAGNMAVKDYFEKNVLPLGKILPQFWIWIFCCLSRGPSSTF